MIAPYLARHCPCGVEFNLSFFFPGGKFTFVESVNWEGVGSIIYIFVKIKLPEKRGVPTLSHRLVMT